MGAFSWGRDVSWRQGSFVPTEATLSVSSDELTIVISHDCDCVNDDLEKEPFLEVIVGSIVATLSGDKTNGKNVRILHLPVVIDGIEHALELNRTASKKLDKKGLAEVRPIGNVSITPSAKKVLTLWLASRYNRATFPNSLVERLRPVDKAFRKIAERNAKAILGVYVDYSPKSELEDILEPYEFDIAVVYDSEIIGASQAAKDAVKDLERAFEIAFRTRETSAGLQWQAIELASCVDASDLQFTLRDLMIYSKYRLDHVSFRADPPNYVAPED